MSNAVMVTIKREIMVFQPEMVIGGRPGDFLSPGTYPVTFERCPGEQVGTWGMLPDGRCATEYQWRVAAGGNPIRFNQPVE